MVCHLLRDGAVGALNPVHLSVLLVSVTSAWSAVSSGSCSGHTGIGETAGKVDLGPGVWDKDRGDRGPLWRFRGTRGVHDPDTIESDDDSPVATRR